MRQSLKLPSPPGLLDERTRRRWAEGLDTSEESAGESDPGIVGYYQATAMEALKLLALGSIFCVVVEVLLNAAGALTWDYGWWRAGAPWLIFLIGYLPFFLVSFWVHDMPRLKQKLLAVGTILSVDIAALLVFGVFLGWI